MKNIFEIFGLGKKEKNPQSKSNDGNTQFPKYDYELEFLKYLNKTPTKFFYKRKNKIKEGDQIFNTYWTSRFEELLGKLDPIVEKLIEDRLLEISLPEESLTINQLKEILRTNELKISGKKEDLVNRVLSEVKDKTYLNLTNPFFRMTPKGELEIEQYKIELEQQFLNFIKTQESIFFRGEFSEFEKNHFYIKSLNPDQRSIGSSFDRFSEKERKILNHLHLNKGFRQPWNFDAESEKKLRFSLALKSIYFPYWKEYSINCFHSFDLSPFKRLLFEELEEGENLSESEILEKFIDYEYNYLWNFYTLKEHKEYLNRRTNSSFSKILILSHWCNCTEKSDSEEYSINEFDRIPVLPRTITCRCQYSMV